MFCLIKTICPGVGKEEEKNEAAPLKTIKLEGELSMFFIDKRHNRKQNIVLLKSCDLHLHFFIKDFMIYFFQKHFLFY